MDSMNCSSVPGDIQRGPAPGRTNPSVVIFLKRRQRNQSPIFGRVLTPRGEWQTPLLFGVLDDHSRLACHVQWYLADENAEDLVHGLIQAFLKRGLPRALLTDNGSAMTATEVTEGLDRTGSRKIFALILNSVDMDPIRRRP